MSVIVTEVPPSGVADAGHARHTVGAGVTWVYSVLAILVPPGVVTSTFAVPATRAGVVAVIAVAFITMTLVAAVAPTASPPRHGLLGVGDRHRRGTVVVPEVGLMPFRRVVAAFTNMTLVAAVAPVGLVTVIVAVGAVIIVAFIISPRRWLPPWCRLPPRRLGLLGVGDRHRRDAAVLPSVE
ncbi:hypothetical protein [Bradyrhizobium sp. URHD0069]|uniref:hypothetical protein n=1 Tax=Bradyrhizobium sp. URHD0069 TaxID=1380355 RepID=UPI00049659EC|nr:hypothetical protein [Bradyrhizobium sp. URHD0069]